MHVTYFDSYQLSAQLTTLRSLINFDKHVDALIDVLYRDGSERDDRRTRMNEIEH